MRRKLILAFGVVALAAIASMFFIVRLSAAGEVRMFVARGGMLGLDRLATDLESYYQQNGSWAGASSMLSNYRFGQGMMNGQTGQGMMGNGFGPGAGGSGPGFHLRLADAQGNIVADNDPSQGGAQVLTAQERSNAIPLFSQQKKTVGFLVAEGVVIDNSASEADLLNRLLRAGLVAAGISGLLALVLAWIFSLGLLRPIDQLTQAARQMAAGNLSQRIEVQGSDEISTLGRAFNQMSTSLQKAGELRRAMTADIAHELRTPIAVQRAHLEALMDGVYPLTAENLQPVLESTDLLTRLVEDLRTLALADAGELKLNMAPLNLASLTAKVVERFKPEADNRGISVFFEDQSAKAQSAGVQSMVTADAGRVEQILNNLLSNALRYTPEGSKVEVSLSASPAWVQVSLSDNGPGIPPEALPHLFERFYRTDRARSREQGGTGLGLAIARQLALAHQGDLTVANGAGGGAVFTLTLPCAGSSPEVSQNTAARHL